MAKTFGSGWTRDMGLLSVADASVTVVNPLPAPLLETTVSDKITHTSDAAFSKDVLESDTPVLLDFWAEWCGPCKSIAPALEQLAGEYEGKVKIVKINIDENQQTPRQYGIRGIPTLMVFKDGKVAGTQVGAVNKGVLAQFIDKSI
ncbi:thioredoxin [Luteibacter sp. 329MFSha]|nr:thioredoxin [Luteibacter sp. 329MFSha]